MKAVDRPSRGTGAATAAQLSASRPKPNLKKVLPEVWKLIKPRRLLLGGSFLLMVVNRASGLVLPASTRYLIDNVMGKHLLYQLPWIVGTVAAATIVQGITSYTLTQLLSKEGQRLIAELRMQVQSHIGRLPVAFYDENRTGTLVARIMTDVEGVRNLIGTGVIDFFGGVLTAVFAFIYLVKLSVQMTLVTFVILVIFGLILQRAFKTIRPILPRARQDRKRRSHRRPPPAPNPSAEFASSRAITPKRARPTSSRRAPTVYSRTSSRPSPRSLLCRLPPPRSLAWSALSSCTSAPTRL